MNTRRVMTVLLLSLLLVTSGLANSRPVAAAYTQQVAFTQIWHDPPGAQVSWVRNAVSMVVNDWGGIENIRCRDTRWWLTQTGWFEEVHNGPNCDVSGNSVDSNSYARMKNPWFCAPYTTWTHYDRNHAYVDPGQTAGWSNTWSDGGCSTWLWTDYLYEPGLYY